MFSKQHASELKVGDIVYAYEVREDDDGNVRILKYEVTIDHDPKFNKARGSGKLYDDNGPITNGFTMAVTGAAGTPYSNKIWFNKRNDLEAYKRLISYYSIRISEAEKTCERMKKRKDLLKQYVEDLKKEKYK